MNEQIDELENEMSRISQQLYCAGWIGDNEYLLWATIVGDSDVYSEADPDSLEQCKSLNAILDGWIHYNLDSGKPEFVTMKDWKKLYRAWSSVWMS